MNKREWICFRIAVAMFGAFVGIAAFCWMVILSGAASAEGLTYECWVMCEPGSEVMIREKPGRSSTVVGAAGCGVQLTTDWEERGEWLHLTDVNNETGEGWIHRGHIVFEEPELMIGMDVEIGGRGRVAMRNGINGKRIRWMKPGSVVQVWYMADGWAVTSKGYVQYKYLEVP